jgi:hypothetical protein
MFYDFNNHTKETVNNIHEKKLYNLENDIGILKYNLTNYNNVKKRISKLEHDVPFLCGGVMSKNEILGLEEVLERMLIMEKEKGFMVTSFGGKWLYWHFIPGITDEGKGEWREYNEETTGDELNGKEEWNQLVKRWNEVWCVASVLFTLFM